MRMPTSNKNLERYVYQDACIIPTHICMCVLKKRLLGCPPDIQSTAVTHAARHPSPVCGDSTVILLGSPPLPSLSPCGCYRPVSTRVLIPTESDSLGVEPSYLLASFFQGSEVMLGEGVNPPRKWHIYRDVLDSKRLGGRDPLPDQSQDELPRWPVPWGREQAAC